MGARRLESSRPPDINVYASDMVSPQKLQFAIERQNVPISPLEELGFLTQMRNQIDPSGRRVPNATQDTEDRPMADTGLDRRFSMVSIETMATTGRLLDHLDLNDEENEIDWAKYNGRLFEQVQTRNQGHRQDRNQMVKQLAEKRLPQRPDEHRNGSIDSMKLGYSAPNQSTPVVASPPIHNNAPVKPSGSFNEHKKQSNSSDQLRKTPKGIPDKVLQPSGVDQLRRAPNFPSDHLLTTNGLDRNRRVKNNSIDYKTATDQYRRAPVIPEVRDKLSDQSRRTPSDSKLQNYVSADKFPSLNRRFVKVQKEPDNIHENNTTNIVTPVGTPQKSELLQPSPFLTPTKFAKDFSDQFETPSPKKRSSPLIIKKIPERPKHVHSFSNPVNLITNSLLSTPKNNSHGSKTPLKRTPSTPSNSTLSRQRLDIDRLIFSRRDEVNPETRVALAIELKYKNQPQELSYQLQIAAEQGNKDAMLLYGLSLRYGYGVKRDERQSFLWLCRGAEVDLIRTYKFDIEPFELLDEEMPKTPIEPLASTLLEIGKSYVNGWGVERDENYGIQFIEKSASLGFTELMLEAGSIWMTKGPNRKKNLHRSASWYRLADKFGETIPGNEWIYKSKYMEKV